MSKLDALLEAISDVLDTVKNQDDLFDLAIAIDEVKDMIPDLEAVEDIKKKYKKKGGCNESIDSLFEGTDYSEDFKEKVSTLFEAAVSSKVSEVTDEIVSALEEKYNEEIDLNTAVANVELEEKVKGYIDALAESWIHENRLAVESGIRLEIMENFIGGMKSVFESSYIDIPEDKIDVLEKLESKIESLESKLDESTSTIVSLNNEVSTLVKEKLISEAVFGLTEIDADRLRNLAEDVSYENEDKFSRKLNTLKESFITKRITKHESPEMIRESFEELNNDDTKVVADANVRNFVNALNRF